MNVTNLTEGKFDKFVNDGKVLVDFYADWCGPCKIVGPIVEELSKENNDVKFGKVDVDKEQELAQRFGVMSIPTLIFFKDKEQVDRFTGALSKEELSKKLEKI